MKKKNLILTLVIGAMLSVTLVGCGGDKEASKSKVEITDVVEAPTEEPATEEPTETVTETEVETEVETETETESEEVTETPVAMNDFFARTNYEPLGSGVYDLQLCPIGSDEREPMSADVIMTQEEVGLGYGYMSTSFQLTIDTAVNESVAYYMTAFDRYTGTCFESAQVASEGFDTNETGMLESDSCIITVDGVEYDCQLECSQDMDGTLLFIMMTVRHPVDYDGVVFQFGSLDSEQNTVYETINFDDAYILDDVPEILENQYFFTFEGI